MASVDRETAAIQDIAKRLDISGTAFAETASEIYRRAKVLPGFSSCQLQAACIYASCRLFGIPRMLKDVSTACGVEVVQLARCYRKVVRNADLRMPVTDPARYAPQIASRAGLDARTERRALEILEAAKNLRMTAGKVPAAVAAAALYAAYTESHPAESFDAGGRVTQKDIADAAGVTEATVRNRLREIRYIVEKEPAAVVTEVRSVELDQKMQSMGSHESTVVAVLGSTGAGSDSNLT